MMVTRVGAGSYATGGGMYVNESSFTIRNSAFEDNQAPGGANAGGAIWVESSAHENFVFSSRFINNTAGAHTGGIMTFNKITVVNSIFDSNSCGGSWNVGAIALEVGADDSKIINCTFTNNNGNTGAGGVLVKSNNVVISNSVFANNTATTGRDLYVFSGSATYEYSLFSVGGVSGGTAGAQNLFETASLKDIGNPIGMDGEWYTDDDGLIPLAESSLIDSGNLMVPYTDKDITGLTRDAFPDLGAYEFFDALSANLIAHYTFEDGNADDQTTNGFNGTINGSIFVNGRFGDGLSFDGVDDDVTMATTVNNLPSGNAARSISLWVNPSDTTQGTIFDYGGTAQYEQFSLKQFGGGGIKFTASIFDVNSGITLTQDVWHHLVITFDSQVITYYLDGVFQTSGSANVLNTTWGTALSFADDIGQGPWGGVIDEVRLYDRALSSDDVTDLYNYVAPPGPFEVFEISFTPPASLIRGDASGNTVLKWEVTAGVNTEVIDGFKIDVFGDVNDLAYFEIWDITNSPTSIYAGNAMTGNVFSGNIEFTDNPLAITPGNTLSFELDVRVKDMTSGDNIEFGMGPDGVLSANILGGNFFTSGLIAFNGGAAPVAPAWVTATPGDTMIGLAWDEVTGATNYTLYWDDIPSQGMASSNSISLSGNTYVVRALGNGLPTYFTVSSNVSGILSSNSMEVMATPDVNAAKYILVDVSAGPSAMHYPVTLADLTLSDFTGPGNIIYKTNLIALKRIPAGNFIMGDVGAGVTPEHNVNITRDTFAGVFEITQKQWLNVMGSFPQAQDFTNADNTLPIIRVSWGDIRGLSSSYDWPANTSIDSSSFMGLLQDKTGLSFDLPTEAQWEHFARAGAATRWHYGDTVNGAYTWYTANSGSSTKEVGKLLPNPNGLFDITGNIVEWVLDWLDAGYYSSSPADDPPGGSSGSNRVYRGGGAISSEAQADEVYRNNSAPNSRWSTTGFRLSLYNSKPTPADPFTAGPFEIAEVSFAPPATLLRGDASGNTVLKWDVTAGANTEVIDGFEIDVFGDVNDLAYFEIWDITNSPFSVYAGNAMTGNVFSGNIDFNGNPFVITPGNSMIFELDVRVKDMTSADNIEFGMGPDGVLSANNLGGNFFTSGLIAFGGASMSFAPILDDTITMTLDSVFEGATNPAGNTVDDIYLTGFSGNAFFDLDGDPSGIAIVSTDETLGSWEYFNGSFWDSIGFVSASNTLLLAGDNLIRFIPSGNLNGTANLSFVAWDQSLGIAGDRNIGLSGNQGGSETFSVNIGLAEIVITPVNDAPILSLNGIVRPNDAFLVISDTNEDELLQINFASANLITISDVDSADQNVYLNIEDKTGLGAIFMGTTNLISVGGNISGDPSVTYQGNVSDLNTALTSLSYQPEGEF